ncbi:KilA-N domain-containing protein [uncultured Draconibacterium sp.]|uniref:KilA-N domain-containing protein n=1 Tax=uncultured Draconibacterium sp. TaxID=1573823 RepID=UPI0025FF1C69|nr:KilA-N domain-containing protein [uncultured Draconibacterium sp.]
MEKSKLSVNELEIVLYKQNEEEYISLTDMAKYRDSERSDYIIQNWMRTRSTVEFLGLWEGLNNPEFNSIEFDGFRIESGSNSFALTPKKWILATNAVGIVSKSGRYGGTYAHKDIAFEFASWLSPTFKLYLITEYQRLKEIETNQYNLEWNVKRILSKTNYHIHTDAVKNYILPERNYEKDKQWILYAEEADLLNVALFNCTAKDWRIANPELAKKSMNIRDIASINELAILSNLETLNAQMIKENIAKQKRFEKLAEIAKYQLTILNDKDFMKALKKMNDRVFVEEQKRLKNND